MLRHASLLAAAALATSVGTASTAGAAVLIDADYDTKQPDQLTGYTYNRFTNIDNGVTADGGVGGTAAQFRSFATDQNTDNFGGYGIGPRSFVTSADFDATPTSLEEFEYSIDVKIEGATGNAGLEVRMDFGRSNGGGISFDVALPYDTTVGGFQTFSGTFAGAQGDLATLIDNFEFITSVRLIQSADLGATGGPFGNDGDNVVTVDNVYLAHVPVPEPASLGLLGLGGAALLRRRRRI